MSRVGRHRSTIHDELGAGANVLLLAPTMDPVGEEACGRLLDVPSADGLVYLSVTLSQGPDDRLNVWRSHVSKEPPRRSGFVTAGDQIRSGAAFDGGTPSDVGPDDARIESVSSPADLTGLGMKISDLLEDLADGTQQIVVCFHTLTILLQYADLQKAFRFLHVLTGRMSAVGAIAHYHMDPSIHDERERNTLTTLFDAVMELDDESEWQLHTR